MRRPDQLLESMARGERPSHRETARLFTGWHSGGADDAQIAGWCMACRAGGHTADALPAVVEGLVAGGRRIDPDALGPAVTVCAPAAVGDPGVLVALPIVASCSVTVPYLCTRGVSDFGGDGDRLQAIPGFLTQLSLADFVADLREHGLVAAADVEGLVPNGRRLASLVERVGLGHDAALGVAGALAGALAGGARAIVLPLPFGRGVAADRADLAALRAAFEVVGDRWQRRIAVLPVEREAVPAGAAGPQVEIAAVGAALRGAGPEALVAWGSELAGAMLEAAEAVPEGAGRAVATGALADGSAMERAERWVEDAGGDPAVWRDARTIPDAPLVVEVTSERAGTVSDIDPSAVGAAARWVGAGRLHPDQAIDLAAGVELAVSVGGSVVPGQAVARVHGRDEGLADTAAIMVARAIYLDGRPLEEAHDA